MTKLAAFVYGFLTCVVFALFCMALWHRSSDLGIFTFLVAVYGPLLVTVVLIVTKQID